MSTVHVVSVSGGKDSTATLLLALERCPAECVVPIYCDTGNEHAEVYEYLAYLEQALDITILRLKADFSEQIASKRRFIANDQRTRREYETVPVFEADGVTPVPKRDGSGRIVMRKVLRHGVWAVEPVQKTKKIGGGVRCAGPTKPSAGRWPSFTRPATRSSTSACGKADFPPARRSSAPRN